MAVNLTTENMFAIIVIVMITVLGFTVFITQYEGQFEQTIEIGDIDYREIIKIFEVDVGIPIPEGETNENIILNTIIPNIDLMPVHEVDTDTSIYSPVNFTSTTSCFWSSTDLTCLQGLVDIPDNLCLPTNTRLALSEGCLVELTASSDEIYRIGEHNFTRGIDKCELSYKTTSSAECDMYCTPASLTWVYHNNPDQYSTNCCPQGYTGLSSGVCAMGTDIVYLVIKGCGAITCPSY